MKRTFLLLAVLAYSATSALAQWHGGDNGRRFGERRTIFSNWTNVSAFGAPIVELGETVGVFGTSVGGGGALLFNNTFFFGGYGMGLTNEPQFTLMETTTGTANLDYGHGGFWTGVNFFPNLPIHPTVSARFGWGQARLQEDGTGTIAALGASEFKDNIFVVQPMAGLEVNVTDWFVVRGQYGYRFVQGLELLDLSGTELDGHFASLTFAFGGF